METPPTTHCPSHALKLLGDYWTLRIVDSLQEKPLRFCELERTLTDSNTVTLTNRLKKMEEAGIVLRNRETIDKQSVVYSLSDSGLGLLPILSEITKFSQRFSA